MTLQKVWAIQTALVSLLLITLGVVIMLAVASVERKRPWWTSWRAALRDVIGGAGAACVMVGVVGVGAGVLTAIG